VERLAQWYKLDRQQVLRWALADPTTPLGPPNGLDGAAFAGATARWLADLRQVAEQSEPAGRRWALIGHARYLHNTRSAALSWIRAHPAEADRLFHDAGYRSMFLPVASTGAAASPTLVEQVTEEAERYYRLARIGHQVRFAADGPHFCGPQQQDLAAQVGRELLSVSPRADNREQPRR
jgi:hypothetical protein